MSDEIVAPEVRDLDTLARQLKDWLAAKMPDARDIAIRNLAYPRGAGQSHETILFDAHWNEAREAREQGMVVRIKPTRHFVYPDDLFDEQYQLMKALHADGRVRVAEPYWIEQDPAILGAPFFVMEKKVGRVPVSIPPYADSGWVADATPAQRAIMWESGVRQLAAIQSIPFEIVPFLAGETEDAREGLEQELDKFRRFIVWAAPATHRPVMDAAMARLEASRPRNQPAGMVWGDSRLGNMMFGADFEVIAVMDWEQPSLGGALHDLAWWLVSAEMHHRANDRRPWLAGMGSRADTIALWQEITGKSADDIEWYEEFVALKMACCSFKTSELGRYPLASPAQMAARLKVTEAA